MNFESDKFSQLLTYNSKEPVLFNSALFLFMLLGVLLIYYILQKRNSARIFFLTVFSLYFYYKSCGYFVGLIVLSAVIDYNLSQLIYKSENQIKRKAIMILSVTLNLGMLAYFKYTNFFIEIINQFQTNKISFFTIFLPVGISFYTFENLSYTIDVYRKEFKPINNFFDYLFFLSFFPKLIAGPIVRASDFIPQIRMKYEINKERFGKGLFLICGGLIKKAIISDYISINFVDRVFDNPNLYTGIENLFAVYGYTLQIYCDFSGYSDIAIGIALWLGFTIPENFNLPYQSTNITEFWHKWHISLSTWLRDYLYIPLGGNKKGKWRQHLNLFTTMVLGGLWHGASFKFVLWGAMHGIGLAIDKQFVNFRKSKNNVALKFIGWLITFNFVAFCWIFFRAADLNNVREILNQIANSAVSFKMIDTVIISYKPVFILLALGYLMHFTPKILNKGVENTLSKSPILVQSIILSLVIWLVIQTKSAEIQPFIYFQF